MEPSTPPPEKQPPTPTQAPPPQTPSTPDPYTGMTGSAIAAVKKPIPRGIYALAAWSLLGFGISFFDTSQNSLLFTLILLADLLLCIGLFLRMEAARTLSIWASGLTIALAVVSIILAVMLQGKLRTSKANYDAAISRLDKNRLTSVQETQLAELDARIKDAEKKAGKAIQFTYIKLATSIVGSSVFVVYLTRPKVKAAFESTPEH